MTSDFGDGKLWARNWITRPRGERTRSDDLFADSIRAGNILFADDGARRKLPLGHDGRYRIWRNSGGTWIGGCDRAFH